MYSGILNATTSITIKFLEHILRSIIGNMYKYPTRKENVQISNKKGNSLRYHFTILVQRHHACSEDIDYIRFLSQKRMNGLAESLCSKCSGTALWSVSHNGVPGLPTCWALLCSSLGSSCLLIQTLGGNADGSRLWAPVTRLGDLGHREHCGYLRSIHGHLRFLK